MWQTLYVYRHRPKWAAASVNTSARSHIFICYLITPEALKDKVDSPWACSFSAPDLSPHCAMMPTDEFQPVQLKGEIMDLEFTIDTDHRSVAFNALPAVIAFYLPTY